MRRFTTAGDLYFVTITVVAWVDLFTRNIYKDFLIDSLKFCQTNKNLEIFSYVIMTNHIHMVARCMDQPLNNVLRDFKTFTSKELFKMIKRDSVESRRRWLINEFKFQAKNGPKYKHNKHHKIWKNENYPVYLDAPPIIDQKVDYIHNNPVKAGIVVDPSDYIYSSACTDSPLKVSEL